jgi:hypothetical protein
MRGRINAGREADKRHGRSLRGKIGMKCQRMVDETVWIGKECASSCLRTDGLLLVYLLVDDRCWLLWELSGLL